ncbi:MAG TPA: tripartite tricarboxylate transporter substrate binding protein [Xanthobacteraceae bacterium]|nr:tripartite tricarboxylate transporter substrate binding protein [Xanthobacteraceae bacterium]
MLRRLRSGALALACLAAAVLAPPAVAQDYPNRPIHFIVGFAAGGPNDIVARILGEWLSKHMGQQWVIENRAGSGGMLAAGSVINSAPDGYTVMFVAPNNAIGESLYKKLPFNFIRDTVPVAGTLRLANLMVVPPDFPAKTVAEFIAHAKANPGKLNFASSGNGTSVHMSGELFKLMAGIDIVHVPYRGSSAAYPDLMSGKVHVLFDNLPGSINFAREGKLKALGVTTAKRWDSTPDIPAIAETVKDYEASVWYGISAPKGTPPQVVDKLNKAVNAALADPAMVKRFAELGAVPMPMSPAEFGKLVADETVKWKKVVEFAGISVE